jgi:succinate-acetate transporter protein
MLRPLGSPLPFGFAGLAIASLVVTGLEWSWVPVVQGTQVGFLVLITAVPLQLVAALFAFLARDGATATAMGVLSASWASIGLSHLVGPPGTTSHALGLVLVMAAAILAGSALAQAGGKVVPGLLVGVAAARFALTGLYELTGSTGWQDASGAVGLAVCALALYSVWALELEDARDRTVLPLGRHGGVEREAGVRGQL